ncbi:uncharacterized protein LOC142973414 [Anticarsia gemmatalis]|uniref:uncharacterized protein LOC142973414 n=1 Tax=Anticarsia gemmatalis TaxID=129554 RepID=UPI003F75E97C
MASSQSYGNVNHPFVVWGSCFLWLSSMFAIAWSLMLFFCCADVLVLTGTDMINAVVLLSGIIMLPTNVHMLCAIANGQKIDHKSKVICCPLWLCIVWIIAINTVGAVLCAYKIYVCKATLISRINSTIVNYRTVPKYKHFIDNLQWSLKCCGLDSYKDWFDHDWYDKIRDYEWDPSQANHIVSPIQDIKTATDSVPLSCCKSGTCVSNYLIELGTTSIHTRGCGDVIYKIIISSLSAHLVMFLAIVIVEGVILKLIMPTNKPTSTKAGKTAVAANLNIRHIMSVNNNFSSSSESLQLNPDDSDEFLRAERLCTPRRGKQVRINKFRNFKKAIDDECPKSPEEVEKWEDD